MSFRDTSKKATAELESRLRSFLAQLEMVKAIFDSRTAGLERSREEVSRRTTSPTGTLGRRCREPSGDAGVDELVFSPRLRRETRWRRDDRRRGSRSRACKEQRRQN